MTDLGRILIADDQESFLAATVEILREEGYECNCAPDSASAIKMLESAEYDLLISDIKMPGNENLEFIQGLPQVAEGLPVILVTGYPSLQTAIQSIQLPVVAYLLKPFDYDELLKQVRNSIKNFRVSRVARNMEKNLRKWHKDLTDIRKTICGHAQQEYNPKNVSGFFNFTLKNISDAMLDLRNLAEAVTINSDQQEVCNLLNCPRLDTLQDALGKVYTTLERTKRAFKSKELGELSRTLKDVFEVDLKVKNGVANNS